MSYYHVCPDCRANLDPGERCDCKKTTEREMTKSDRLIIGFDNAQNGDRVVLTIGRKIGRGFQILNQYQDDEAREMYLKLVTQAPEGKIKHTL